MRADLQIKIILLFCVLGMVIIFGLGIYFTTIIESIIPTIQTLDTGTSGEVIKLVNEQLNQTRLIVIIAVVLFGIISIIVGAFVTKVLISPMTKLIDSAKQIVAGENNEIKYLSEGNKGKEITDIEDAFAVMTNELKENLKEVNTQKKQIETILTLMTDGIIVFDTKGCIIHINPAAKRYLNIVSENETFQEMFERLDLEMNIEKIIYLETLTVFEEQIKVGEKYYNLCFAPYTNENGEPSGVMIGIQNITEHVKLDNMRKEFVANVSHELKTPITSVMGYSETLLEGEYDEETQKRFLGVINSEAKRMANLVTDLLDLARYDNNKVQIEKTEFDLEEMVRKCQESLEIEIDKKKHNVESHMMTTLPPVFADKNSIQRVILNILTNSIKYTPDNGEIQIYVGRIFNDAYIKVIDNGIGIPEENLERIFERFYRVDKARTRKLGGTGLGLSIAKEILDQNNGSIDIKNRNKEREDVTGVEVVIRIPLKK